jgi:CubicO group peptidase (beta-lactamase class C family)
MRWALLSILGLILGAACGGDDASELPDGGAGDAEVDSGPVDAETPDAADAHDAGDPWSVVRARLDEAVADGTIPGWQLAVRDGTTLRFSGAGGAYTEDTEIPFDSCIKPVTSALVLSLVRDDLLALDDTLASLAAWEGPEGAVTVDSLLTFASGFDGDAPCLTPPPMLRMGRLTVPPDRASLADCTEEVRAGGLVAEPATEFRYGGVHQMILAWLAETRTGRDWSTLFAERIDGPLGLGGRIVYRNNRVAASATGDARALSAVFERLGRDGGWIASEDGTPSLLPEALVEVLFRDVYPDVEVIDTPWEATGDDVHFARGAWRDCEDHTTATGCLLFGSGANGTTAWIDPEGRYAAALVFYQGRFTGYRDGYVLMRELAPTIRAALAD